jgi:hypothetical protein
MGDTMESAWVLREAPTSGGLPPRYVGNPHGEPRYVEAPMSAHFFATETDAEAARRSGEVVHKWEKQKPIGRE